MSQLFNIITAAEQSDAYRRVLVTGDRLQVVTMALGPGESIGAEKHAHVEQAIMCIEGAGVAFVDGMHRAFEIGDLLVVTPGTEHDVQAGPEGLKLLTIYAPPNHLPKTIHNTRQDAEMDVEDEEYSRRVR